MKKQFGLPLMLASALAFSACSSDDVAENGPKDIAALTNGGYVKMTINLPSRAANGGFKATDDQTGHVTLGDGLAKEYNVKNAILVLFQGNDEADATFHSAYDISTSMQMEGTNEHITSTTKLVQNVTGGGTANPITGDHLYALVVLNNNGLFKVTTHNGLEIKSVANASDAMPADGTSFTGKFSEFQALKATADKSFYTDDKTGILMMNAPLYETTGGTAKPTNLTTLAEVTNNVYMTAMEAQNNPGAEIFVERAVAKVTMASTITTPVLSGDEYKTTNSLTASLDSWGLDYTNNISYLIHNAAPATNPWVGYNAMGDATTTNYRFGGNTAVKTGYGYRAYWGVDPNYAAADGKAATYGAKNFVRITDAGGTGLTTAKDEANPLYCMENTFNVQNMNEDQTTRAIVKVKLTPTTGSSTITMDADGSFYIVNGNKSQIFDETKLKTFIFENFVKKCNTVYKASLTPKGDPTKADITFTTLDGNSEMSVDKLVVTYTDHSIETYDNTSTAVAEVNAALKKVTKYVGGYAYYPIRIKHFGKDLTPWDATKHTQNDRYDTNNENKFLGRYGVLRNNWYDLVINSISGVGSPVIPNAPGSPDDELESFISVRINVLSWAKRVQREDL